MKTSNNQANILSNLSFILVDTLESSFMEANEKLKADNCEFKREAKREFNLLLSHCRNLKRIIRSCSQETQEDFGDDSDKLFQTIKLILDRTGDNEEISLQIFNYIKQLPSRLDIDVDESVFRNQ